MAQTVSPSSISFKVQRSAPELVTPAKPTPYEFKSLSNLDWFKDQVYTLRFYPHNPSMNGVDPARLIRDAIAQTLVFYYPLAGRLRECLEGKLEVECTGEGILFTEANADVTLDQFGYPIVPPFPCLDQLLYEELDTKNILNTPLALFQVTRLKCGGFIFGSRLNHNMCDGAGITQFLTAIGEMSRGATSPSVLPVWERHVLNSMNPTLPEQNHELSESEQTNNLDLPLDLCNKSFIFTQTEISALRAHIPRHLRHCSTFELVTAAVWKCRVAAVQPDPSSEETTSLIWPVNLRNKKLSYFIPLGYYGNALGYSKSTSTATEILKNPLHYTLQLLKKGTEKVHTDQYRPQSVTDSPYFVSDLRNSGMEDVDFGWGKALYAGPVICMPTFGWYQRQFRRNKRELNGIMFPLCLPKQAMEIFEMELNNLLKEQPFTSDDNAILSKL